MSPTTEHRDPQPVQILLVEDDRADAELTRAGLEAGRLANKLHTVGDGEEALAWLRREAPFQDAPRPDLILLDLNMPRMDGHEFLQVIKSEPDFRSIPIVVLTTSVDEADVAKSYLSHANAYMSKPVRFQDFVDLVRDLGHYWFTLVRLPSRTLGSSSHAPASSDAFESKYRHE